MGIYQKSDRSLYLENHRTKRSFIISIASLIEGLWRFIEGRTYRFFRLVRPETINEPPHVLKTWFLGKNGY